jgi:hypothetical protein
MLAGIGRSPVHRLAEIDAIVEDLIDRALVDQLAPPMFAILRCPALGGVAGLAQLLRELRR